VSINEKPCGCEISKKMNPTNVGTCSCEGGAKTNSIDESTCGCGGNAKSHSIDETECGCAADKIAKTAEKSGRLHIVPAPRIYLERRPVKGEVVTLIDVTFSSSSIDLVDAWSRAVSRGEVHEIMIWHPLENGDDAAAVAFIEITQGGNLINGDEIKLDGEAIGNLAGFDYNHMPNHMNIVFETKSLNLLLKLGSIIEFSPNTMLPMLGEDCC
jgi:hypothetical protein